MASTSSISPRTEWITGSCPISAATSSTISPACWLNSPPRPEALVFCVRRAAGVREVFLLDFLGVEFRGALAHGLQHFFERRRLALDPAQGIDARDDESAQVGADEAARLQLGDDLGDARIQVRQHAGVPLVRFDRFRQRLLRKLFQAPHDRVVGAAGELALVLVTDAERDERGFLQVVGELSFGASRVLGVPQQAAGDADHFEGLLAQVVRFFRVEREDLPGDLAPGHHERGDGPRAQPAHRFEAMPAVRGPEAFVGRGDRDHRIQKHPGAVEDVGELPVVGLREIALEGRGLDAIDGKDREQERVLPERIVVRPEHQTPFALDPRAHFLGFGRKRVEPALGRQEAACAGLGLSRRALRGGALESGFALGLGRCHGHYARAARLSKNSNIPLPAIIATRKTRPFSEPVPARTSAGPGQIPASPQPTPNTRLPRMSRLSILRAPGRSTGAPSSVRVRFFMSAKAAAATATAPAMTSASEGSQAPARSRKPSTFAGFAIPETRSPSPKTKPAVKEAAVYTEGLIARSGGARRIRSRSPPP